VVVCNTARTCRGKRSAQSGLHDTIWLVVGGRAGGVGGYLMEDNVALVKSRMR